ncbi:MAG: FAD-dependent oxidoreductase [Candidatus Babeliales bacterium]
MLQKQNIFLISGLVLALGAFSLIYVWNVRCKSSRRYTISKEMALEAKGVVPVLVLGSGPAGLTAALYSARANIKTLVLEGNKPGGALMETSYIENWPGVKRILGSQVIGQLKQQAVSFGAEFLVDSATSIDMSVWPFIVATENGITIRALTIIVATGSTPKKLGIPGEAQYWGKGVTTCAVCDAPLHKGNDVVVIGGGDSAIEESLQLAPYAKTVTILVRKDAMRAAASMQDRMKEVKNIKVEYNVELQEIKGTDSEVTEVVIKNSKTGEVSIKKVTGVFLAIGHDPNSQLFKEEGMVDKNGYLQLVKRSQKTPVEGIYAAGDVADPVYKQAGYSAGAGTAAALDAASFLQDYGFNAAVFKQMEPNFFEPFLEEKIEVPLMTSLAQLKNVLTFSKTPVFVDFFAEYCPSCMRMLPSVASVGAQFEDKALFVKVDVEQAKEIADAYHVGAIPVLLVFKNGQLVARYNEAMTRKELVDFVEQFI